MKTTSHNRARRPLLVLAALVLCAAATAALLSACGGASDGKPRPIRLTYSIFFPPMHLQTQTAIRWAEEIERRTDGRVKITPYYGESFALDDSNKSKARVQAYIDLDKAGFDQIPTGSNWSNDVNFGNTVKFCEEHLSKEHLLGYLTAPWVFTLPKFEAPNLRAIDQVAEARKAAERG